MKLRLHTKDGRVISYEFKMRVIILGVRWLVTVVGVQERLSLSGDCEMNLYKINYIANLKDFVEFWRGVKDCMYIVSFAKK